MTPEFAFPHFSLPEALVQNLRAMNPWWEGKPGPVLPFTRRHLVAQVRRRLDANILQSVAVRGPRRVGKTIAQLQLIHDELARGRSPRRVLRVQFDELPSLRGVDEPILRITEWYQAAVLGRTLNEAAHAGEPALLFFDEVQNLPSWAEQLKTLLDHNTVQAVVTGSSALRIELGRDSLAGRVSYIEAGVLSLTEIARFRADDLGEPFLPDNGLEPLLRRDFWLDLGAHGRALAPARDRAFDALSERGGYPLAHDRADLPWPAIAEELVEQVVKRVIQHDLRIGERGRKRDQALLEEVFRLACRYIGQAPERETLARETQRVLEANIGAQRVRHYLDFLNDALLLRLIRPLEIRIKRSHGQDKICLADHALRAAWLQEVIPLAPAALAAAPHLTDLAGRVADSVVGACLCTLPKLGLSWLPARKDGPEVDYVLTIGTQRIPLELKYQRRINALADTEGLRTFIEKTANNAPFGVLVTQTETDAVVDPRIITLPLSSLLLLR